MIEKMQALSAERSIFEGESEVRELFRFITENAKVLNACEIEKAIFTRLMRIGQSGLKAYFAQKGTGDIGGEPEINGVILNKESVLRECDYFSVFGKIRVPGTCYRQDGYCGVMPSDAFADLPGRCCSCLLQEWMNLMSIRESYKESELTLSGLLGLEVSAGRFEVVNKEGCGDYGEFYRQKELPAVESEGKIQAVSFDGKGVPMIKREAAKLKARQGKGEKRQKRKEAMVGAGYTVDRNERTAEEVAENLIYPEKSRTKKEGDSEPPKAKNIRRLASIGMSKQDVAEEIINDGKKRNEGNNRPIAVLMDGASGLWSIVVKAFKGLEHTGILDIIHVVEYLWKAGDALYGENTKEGGEWVHQQLLSILRGGAGRVIGGLKQTITKRKLKKSSRKAVESAICYFENHRERMKYDEYLNAGFPIGTGVVESTCSHTVKKRMEGSGRRWSTEGAEGVLLLRSIYTSGDWDAYRKTHMQLERERLYGDVLKVLSASDDYHSESGKIKKAA